MENWKTINNYPNYEISTIGRVRNKKTKRILIQSNRGNYLCISLSKNNVSKSFNIHRIVGENFLPNFFGKKTIDHINRNKKDNRLINLRWATMKEQSQNRISIYKGGYIQHRTKNCFRLCWQIDNKKFSKNFKTKQEAEYFKSKLYLKYQVPASQV